MSHSNRVATGSGTIFRVRKDRSPDPAPVGPGDRRGWLLAAFPILLCTGGCDRAAPEPTPDRVERVTTGNRVVSLSPLATRFVLAIGAGERIVAGDAVSARMPELAGRPAVDLAGAVDLRPDLVLVPLALDPGDPAAAALHRRGARIVEFAPHDFEDVLPLVREVGGELVGAERATRFERAFSRPLARIGGESQGQPRPRVVAVVSFEPLVIAGGHSFETDLIEIAGGHSVTHPGDESRLAIGADRWTLLAPDLVLVIDAPPASKRAEQALRNAVPPGAAVAFFPFDPAFWIDASDEPARRLRGVIEPIARGMVRARVDSPPTD
jgi:ABC-type hemin transport system substrate-binding protein